MEGSRSEKNNSSTVMIMIMIAIMIVIKVMFVIGIYPEQRIIVIQGLISTNKISWNLIEFK